ncbi:MAG: hypothetical protein ACI4C1_02890 [Lachnospiraceae bacterium]
MLNDNIAKIVVETMVRKTIRDIKEAPQSSTRNLIELAMNFSKGRFQKNFFETAHKMLKNETSGYYSLVSDVVVNVDTERLLKFGMNMGYNGYTVGVEKIRTWEAASNYNVPWTVLFEFGERQMKRYPKRYFSMVKEGEQMGIFTWAIFMDYFDRNILSILKEFTNSAFFLFCPSNVLTEEFLDEMKLFNNVAIMVLYDEKAEHICHRLREEKMLYGCYYNYTEQDIDKIANGDLFYSMQQLHPLAAVLIHQHGCPEYVQNQVYHMVTEARVSQEYKMILWELYGDNCYIDKIVSEDTCFVYFDKNGNFRYPGKIKSIQESNIYLESLQEILAKAFLKTHTDS